MQHTYDSSSEDDEEKDVYDIKIFVVGESNVGKTTLIKRILFNSFTLCYTPTKTVEIYKKVMIGRCIFTFIDIPYMIDIYNLNAGPHDAVAMVVSDSSNVASITKMWEFYFHDIACNFLVVYNKKTVNSGRRPFQVEPYFEVNTMSNEGINKLIYGIHKICT